MYNEILHDFGGFRNCRQLVWYKSYVGEVTNNNTNMSADDTQTYISYSIQKDRTRQRQRQRIPEKKEHILIWQRWHHQVEHMNLIIVLSHFFLSCRNEMNVWLHQFQCYWFVESGKHAEEINWILIANKGCSPRFVPTQMCIPCANGSHLFSAKPPCRD